MRCLLHCAVAAIVALVAVGCDKPRSNQDADGAPSTAGATGIGDECQGGSSDSCPREAKPEKYPSNGDSVHAAMI